MPEIIAGFAADLHVRNYDRVWSDPEYRQLTGDTAFALQQICEITEKYRPRAFLLGGDNTDAKLQRSDAIAILQTFLMRMHRSTEVLYVQGQHELSDPPLVSAIHPTTHSLHQKLRQIGGFSFYGLDYTPAGQVAEALRAVPPCDVLLTHQVWKDFMGDDRGEASMLDIPSCKLLLTGDFHKTKLETKACAAGPMRVVSPGPICMQAIDESGEKFVFLITDTLEVVPVPLKSRRYFEVTVMSQEQVDSTVAFFEKLEAVNWLPLNLQKSILRVHYPLNQPEIYSKLKSALEQYVYLFWKPMAVITEDAKPDDVQKRQAAVADGMEGIVAAFYNEDPIAASIAVRLNRAVDINEELNLIYSELVKVPA